jgi:hypothetical protein
VSEWFKEHVLKTCVGQLTESSNLSLSATKKVELLLGFFRAPRSRLELSGFAKQNIPRVRRSE